MAIKVSAKTVAQLRKGTMAGNLAKAKGASPEMREALTRFYGSSRVNAAIGKNGPGSVGKPKPMTPKPNDRENRPEPVVGPANDREGRKAAVMSPKPSGGPGAKMTPRPSGGPGAKMPKTPASSSAKPLPYKSESQKPLIDLPKKLASAKAKLNASGISKQAAYDKALKSARAQAAAKKKGMK
jgi:hypothetical protein